VDAHQQAQGRDEAGPTTAARTQPKKTGLFGGLINRFRGIPVTDRS
jgi:hypothetical protein